MSQEHKNGKKPARVPEVAGGFWGHTKPKPAVLSVRHSSSRFARSVAFLRRLVGWDRKNDKT